MSKLKMRKAFLIITLLVSFTSVNDTMKVYLIHILRDEGVDIDMSDREKERLLPKCSPEVNAGILSKISFSWVQRIFTIGNERTVTEYDVFPIDPSLESEQGAISLEQHWFDEKKRTKTPSLATVLVKKHRKAVAIFALAFNIEAIFKCTLPYIIARTTSYFDPNVIVSLETAIFWSFIMAGAILIFAALRNYFYYNLNRFGSLLRIEVTGLIYRKACRITQKEIGERSTGFVVNLTTNDTQRLDDMVAETLVVFNIFTIILLTFLIMYYEIGLSATLAGLACIFMFLPMQIATSKLVIFLREKASVLTDSRVRIIHDMVLFIKVIKMYAWELMFKELVNKIRSKECRYIALFDIAQGRIQCAIAPIVALMMVIVIKIQVGEPMTSTQVLFFLAMAEFLSLHCVGFLTRTLLDLSQVYHSFGRIQAFLNADEIPCNPASVQNNSRKTNQRFQKCQLVPSEKESVNALELVQLSSSWGEASFSLENVNLVVQKGELVAVVGPVACGKTTLLTTLLRELSSKGELTIDGQTSFSAQIPWIFNGDIKDNILFNRPLNEDKLKKCIESCYLSEDLKQLPDGLYTIVGERGVQLSGGQKARVSLARAIYGEEDIILMDDPLSALDSKCAKHVFQKLISKHLVGKTRIVVTHSTQFLSEFDKIVVMDTEVITNCGEAKTVGKIIHTGTYEELVSKGVKLSHLQDRKENIKERKTSNGSEKDNSGNLNNICANHPTKRASFPSQENKTGSLNRFLYIKYVSLSFGYIVFPILFIAMVSPQILVIYQQQYAIDWLNNPRTPTINSSVIKLQQIEGRRHFHTYLILAFIAIALISLRLGIYVPLIYKSAQKLHNKALHAVLRSPMRFFDTNTIGMIINRFSKDTFYLDEKFSGSSFTLLCGLVLHGSSIALLLMANGWFAIPLVLFILIFILLVRYYLRVSIELRRIEASKRSPVMSHISATLSGLTTIRAGGQVGVFESQYYNLRDDHTRCWMLYLAANRWFLWRLDMLVSLCSVVAVFMTVLLKDMIGGRLAGLALVYITNMANALQYCMKHFTDTENIMTAVERIFSFTDLPPEAPLEFPGFSKKVLSNMNVVESGVMQFVDVSAKYNEETGYVLKDVSFTTKPGEKIGIVGRTGAGKSTILQALFRMIEPEGDIFLNGSSIKEMGLHQLRRSISIIPQESLLFSETLRVNLDPFSEFIDEQIWDVLGKAKLRKFVGAQRGGLEMMIREGGGNLSAGQRQLLCLARALLRDNKFLVVDEATANVDESTDQLIQGTLRDEFAQCTVLTIAHRLKTIIDSDRIMVIDAGRLVEFDRPAVLLNRKEGVFYELAKESGVSDLLLGEECC